MLKSGNYYFETREDELFEFSSKKEAILNAVAHKSPCVQGPSGKVVWINPKGGYDREGNFVKVQM